MASDLDFRVQPVKAFFATDKHGPLDRDQYVERHRTDGTLAVDDLSDRLPVVDRAALALFCLVLGAHTFS